MTFEEKKEKQIKFNNIAYYLIIGVVSIVVTGFVPMLSSKVGLEWQIPDTTAGWVVWILSKLCIAGINMLMFYCFMQQAKLNVRDNEKYKQAKEILHSEYKVKKIKPKSPKEWKSKQYMSKGTTLLLSSVLSCVGLTQAILDFRIVEFLSSLFTVLMGITFGYLQMRKAEDYWTSEFYEYAIMIKEQIDKKELEDEVSRKALEELEKEITQDDKD